jgi:hypothetical protein
MANEDDLLAKMASLLDAQKASLAKEMESLVKKVEDLQAQVSSLQAPGGGATPAQLGATVVIASSGAGASSSTAVPLGAAAPGASASVSLTSDDISCSMSIDDAASAWDGHKELKLRELAKLGRGKGELSYSSWKTFALADLDAARLTPVLTLEYPEQASAEVQAFYKAANSVVYAGLLHAVKEINVLRDHVLRLHGHVSSARFVWLAIKAHFVRASHNNDLHLLTKLKALAPREKESMESFLNRCNLLVKEYSEYDLVCDETLLISQVLSTLASQWKTNAKLDRPLAELTWDEVARALQAEDNNRRMSNTDAPESLLPLGWTRRSGGARAASGDSGSSGEQPPSNPDANAAPAGATPKGGKWKPKHAAPKGAPPQGEQRVTAPVVCWLCKEVGHLYGECKSDRAGQKPSAQDRAEAEAKREELRRRREQSVKDKAAHAARAASQGESPAEARCSGAL